MKKLRQIAISLTIAAMLAVAGFGGTIGAAENSKKLVLYSAGPAPLAKEINKGFEAKTGITVEMFQGTTGDILGRIEAEKNNPLVDVVVLASWPSAEGMKLAGLTQAYSNPQNADKLHPAWRDKNNHYFGYSASAVGLTYNTLLVKNPPKDWSDLAKPEWRDKLNMPDPTLSGSCLDFISGYASARKAAAWNYFQQLKKNNLLITGANNTALDMVVAGSKSIVLAGVDYMTYDAKAKGEPVEMIYPASGTVVNPRPAMIIKTSKNVANARLFIDYLLSDEVQKLVVKAYILPGRMDITSDKRPNVNQIPVLKYSWSWMARHTDDSLGQFNQIFK